jgi:hypothetical protein
LGKLVYLRAQEKGKQSWLATGNIQLDQRLAAQTKTTAYGFCTPTKRRMPSARERSPPGWTISQLFQQCSLATLQTWIGDGGDESVGRWLDGQRLTHGPIKIIVDRQPASQLKLLEERQLPFNSLSKSSIRNRNPLSWSVSPRCRKPKPRTLDTDPVACPLYQARLDCCRNDGRKCSLAHHAAGNLPIDVSKSKPIRLAAKLLSHDRANQPGEVVASLPKVAGKNGPRIQIGWHFEPTAIATRRLFC